MLEKSDRKNRKDERERKGERGNCKSSAIEKDIKIQENKENVL